MVWIGLFAVFVFYYLQISWYKMNTLFGLEIVSSLAKKQQQKNKMLKSDGDIFTLFRYHYYVI